jgi:hypothetical protein
MATEKNRINISVSKEITAVIEKLARRDEVPVATKARQLVEQALQIEEDDVLNAIASGRDKKDARYIPHNEAWK